jgi:uncharacterized protein
MSNTHGRFVWYELMTTDTAAADTFYRDVVGWSAQDSGMPEIEIKYTLFMMGDAHIAGLMDIPPEAQGVPPNWLGYVAADDVDATTAQAQRLGASVHVAPRNIPNVGRFSVLGDPQGATFALFKSANQPEGGLPDQMAPGRIGWHELYAADWTTAFPFYSELFGWRKLDAMDMGAMGTYQLFGIDAAPIGGMMSKPPEIPVPFWLYYFNVGDIDAAVGRVTAGGGRLMMGPIEVPGGSFVIQAQDPQGGMFALAGRRG